MAALKRPLSDSKNFAQLGSFHFNEMIMDILILLKNLKYSENRQNISKVLIGWLRF